MKKQMIIALLALCTAAYSQNLVDNSQTALSPVQYSANDSLQLVARYKMLNIMESTLKKRIQEEDAKRKNSYNGMTEGRAEEWNNRQDSICLIFRSQLVDVQLEMAEIKEECLLRAIKRKSQHLVH